MTENEIKEMLKDIIDNGAEYEYRIKTPLHHYNKYYFTNWKPYKLGDEIHDDYEYRKKEKWCVTTQKEIIELNLLKSYETPIFVGNKEECEKWIEKHIKKTWLDETCEQRMKYEKDYLKEESEHIYNSTKYGIKEVCKKILEEFQNKMDKRVKVGFTFASVSTNELKQIIKDLGVEL